jgi:type II secretory pathway pseudopilin PulG
MNRVDKRKGFTLIELMLAMGFVAALLIAIAMTVIQIANIYNRGLTLKEVNQAGRSIASELQRGIAASTPFSVDPGVGSHYIFEKVLVNTRYVPQPWGGRLCVGQYSYIWNYGKDIQTYLNNITRSSNLNVYGDATATPTPIRFVKVVDPSAKYCDNVKMNDGTALGSKYIYSTDSPVELLDESQHDLAIHSFKITTTADNPATPLINENTAGDANTNQQLYSIEFVLGTNEYLRNISTLTTDPITGDAICKPPSDQNADPAYCSVNRFNIVARSGNTK